jgi:hypothetical protein
MFRSVPRVVIPVGLVSASVIASLANAQKPPTNPATAQNPLTMTIFIFRSNMQDKIVKSAEAMPESKYGYQPTKDVRSFGEILNHVADISYIYFAGGRGADSQSAVSALMRTRFKAVNQASPARPIRCDFNRTAVRLT